jgi:Homeodomain-like domain
MVRECLGTAPTLAAARDAIAQRDPDAVALSALSAALDEDRFAVYVNRSTGLIWWVRREDGEGPCVLERISADDALTLLQDAPARGVTPDAASDVRDNLADLRLAGVLAETGPDPARVDAAIQERIRRIQQQAGRQVRKLTAMRRRYLGAWLADQGMSQADVARALGVTPQAVSKILGRIEDNSAG